MTNVGDSLVCLEVSERETGSLSHNAVRVLQQGDQTIHNKVTVVAGTTQRDGSHGTDVGVGIFQQINQSLDHSRILELGCMSCVQSVTMCIIE